MQTSPRPSFCYKWLTLANSANTHKHFVSHDCKHFHKQFRIRSQVCNFKIIVIEMESIELLRSRNYEENYILKLIQETFLLNTFLKNFKKKLSLPNPPKNKNVWLKSNTVCRFYLPNSRSFHPCHNLMSWFVFCYNMCTVVLVVEYHTYILFIFIFYICGWWWCVFKFIETFDKLKTASLINTELVQMRWENVVWHWERFAFQTLQSKC